MEQPDPADDLARVEMDALVLEGLRGFPPAMPPVPLDHRRSMERRLLLIVSGEGASRSYRPTPYAPHVALLALSDDALSALAKDVLVYEATHSWGSTSTPPWVAEVTTDLGPVVGAIERRSVARDRVKREVMRRFVTARGCA